MYKYIHILWQDEINFNLLLVEFLHDEDTGICNEEHFFATPFERVYDELKKKAYKNIELYKVDNPYSSDVVNYYAERCQWLFLHNICSPKEICGIKKQYLSKIIWRTWGGGRGYIPFRKGHIYNNLKIIVRNSITKHRIQKFHSVGIANIVDGIELRKHLGRLRMDRIPYPQKQVSAEFIDELVKQSLNVSQEAPLKIMIGHSGFRDDNHIEMLKKMEKYMGEKITIYLILSYGDEGYMNEIRDYVSKVWGEKIIIVDEFMDFRHYAKLLSDISIAVFDAKYSYALGNIAILLKLQKKIFLNENGVIAKAFREANYPFWSTKELGNLSFAEISSNVKYPDDADKDSGLELKDYSEEVCQWKRVIESLT